MCLVHFEEKDSWRDHIKGERGGIKGWGGSEKRTVKQNKQREKAENPGQCCGLNMLAQGIAIHLRFEEELQMRRGSWVIDG